MPRLQVLSRAQIPGPSQLPEHNFMLLFYKWISQFNPSLSHVAQWWGFLKSEHISGTKCIHSLLRMYLCPLWGQHHGRHDAIFKIVFQTMLWSLSSLVHLIKVPIQTQFIFEDMYLLCMKHLCPGTISVSYNSINLARCFSQSTF